MSSTSPVPGTRGRRAVTAIVLSISVGLSTAALGLGASPSSAEPTGSAAPVLKSPAVKKSSAFAQQLEKKYVDPDRVYSTDVRWWLGEASHTDETLLEEIQNLYDGGYRGVELAMQGDNAAPDATYGYGSPMWAHKWDLMMNKLLDLGMGVYLTSGTNWATSNVPGLDPDSQAAMQNLTLGTSTVAPGQSISVLPTPADNVQKAAAKFVTAYAYRVVEGDTLDPNSFIDLSASVTQGATSWVQNKSWTAPSDGTYRVFAMWTQGTYQASSPAATPSYTTNYFDKRGVEALKTFWQEHYLADPALRAKILEGDVQLFMDSLEIHPGGSSEWTAKVATAPQFTFWSQDMAAEFKKRKGYDITPWLFLVKGVQSFSFDAYFDLDDTGNYRIAGQNVRREQIISDYQDVLTQLYRERMLQPLKEWLNSVGIETRTQISYGKPIEISEPIMDTDYPEAENYNQYNQLDLFRLWTGGAKLENKVLSTETGAQMPVYSATRQADLTDAYTQYAAGFQRIVWHVWGAGYSYGNTAWPGHNPTGFRQLGSRNPTSADYDEFNAHLGRVQQLLQTGEARADVGFIRQQWIHGMSKNAGIGNDNGVMNWNLAHQGISYRSTQLQDNGYTYDYFSPKFLFDDDVRFDKKTQTIEKAGYKAIVLYQDWLDLEGAQRILRWAKQGLKVVVLEDAASRTPFNDGKSGALKKVMDEMKTLPTVRQATVYDDFDYFSNAPGGYDDNVMEKLQDLGVQPYTGFSEENLSLLTQTRQDEAGNQFTYVYNFDDGSYHHNSAKASVRNAGTGPHASTDLVKQGTFVPYAIDPWTGHVTELVGYRWENGTTILPIELDYNNIALLAFEKVSGDRLHVLSTNADSSFATPDGLAVRTSESGTVTADLSNGDSVEQQVEVPASYDITDWDLTVESWRPSATPGDLVRTETVEGVTTTNKKSSTVKTAIDVELDTLKTWDNIPEIGKNVSGTGHYEASFEWDADSASGAYLDLGDGFVESMEVWVNGEKVGGEVSTNPTKTKRDVGGVGKSTIDDGRGNQVPLAGKDLYTGGVSWTNPVADISDHLLDGENTIVIDYASSLSNLQLSRGIGTVTPHYRNWWNLKVDYFAFGPSQAKLVPFVDVAYSTKVTGPPTTTPPTTTPPTTVPPTTVPPVVTPKLRVKDKVRAGKMLKVRGRDLSVNKVRVTLGGKKLAVVKVEDGRFKMSRVVPPRMQGRKVLRVLDRTGEVLVQARVRVLKRTAS